jgi:peptide/nickel transport system substrate-binding protein
VAVLVASGVVAVATSAASPNHRAADSATFTYVKFTASVVSGWDPAVMTGGANVMFANIYQTLTHYNWSKQKTEPELATSWTSSKNGLRWTFQLRPNVRFHTGKLMTAASVKAAIMRTIHLGQGDSYIWDPVKSITTHGKLTVIFNLKYPAPLDKIASAGYAAFIYDTKAPAGQNLVKWFAANHDSGTGPYTIAKYSPGTEFELTLDAYAKYWGGWNGAHYKRVVYRVVPDNNTAAQLLKSGEATYVAYLPPQLWSSVGSAARTISSKSLLNFFLFLNTEKPGLSDVRVRRAIGYALDYPAMVSVLQGSVYRSGIVPPGLLGYSKTAPIYTTDTAKATQLLQSAGYGPNGKKLDLLLTYTQGQPAEEAAATLIKSSLAKVGIDVTLQALQYPAQLGKAISSDKSQRQDLTMLAWWPEYPTASSWFKNMYHSESTPLHNLSYFTDPVLDRLTDQVTRVAAVNPKKAAAMYATMQKLAFNDAAALPLFTQIYQRALAKNVVNFTENPVYPNVVFVYKLRVGK